MLSRYQEYGPGQFKPSFFLGSFLGDPPVIPESSPDVTGDPVCMMSTSSVEANQEIDMSNNDIESLSMTTSLAYATSQTPFLYPPTGFVSQQVLATLVLPNISLEIIAWYLIPPMGTGATHIISIGLKPLSPEEAPPIQETVKTIPAKEISIAKPAITA